MTKGNILPLCALPVLLFGMACHGADNIVMQSGGGTYSIKTSTLKDYRYRETIVQQRDFSCGSAALATLLHYHYERPVTEFEALRSMYLVGDQEKIRKEGFSLLDMKKYLASIGMQAEGYRVSLDKMAEVSIPGIALLDVKGYLHFVLVRGISNDRVLVADPALGMKTFSRDKFKEMWNGIYFVILSDKPTGRAHFNLAKHWGRAISDHDTRQIVSGEGLGSLTLHVSQAPGYF